MKSLLLLSVLALSASVLSAQDDEQGGSATLARLLVSKQIQNK
jgi:hypothetical protein